MNGTYITGRLIRDPEKSITQEGKTKASFSVAVDRPYKPKDAKFPETDFYYCIAYEGRAEFILDHFRKGKAIELTLSYRTYKNKENKTSHYFAVDRAGFVPRDSEATRVDDLNGGVYPEEPPEVNITDDDLPF